MAMKFGLEVIDNVPVYRRIGIGETQAAKTAEQHAREAIVIIDATLARLEAEQASEGNG